MGTVAGGVRMNDCTFLGMYATGRDSASFYVIGNAVQVAAGSGIYGVTMSVGGERWSGTLPYLFGSPANRMTMFVGRALRCPMQRANVVARPEGMYKQEHTYGTARDHLVSYHPQRP